MDLEALIVRNEIVPAGGHADEWDSIVTSRELKDKLVRSVVLGLTLRRTVPFHVSALHGLALLIGPPGTGKSTLIRGLAGQVATVIGQQQCRLVEINPHGLMSAEHGKSQQRVHELLTEYVPSLAEDKMPTIVMLDEVETLAVARSQASLAANPADVHRATDAVLTALDAIAARAPHIFTVATSNFDGALDEAFKSRADVLINMPLPDEDAITKILQETLRGFAVTYTDLRPLADDPGLRGVARALLGADGRSIRKSVTEAMLLRLDVTQHPGHLTLADLQEVADDRVIKTLELDRAAK